MIHMRTTLTLDEDVVRLIEDAVHQEHRPMKHIINDALRRALAPEPSRRVRYQVKPHESALRPGFDPAGFNRLTDELETEAILDKMRRNS